jgi:hypothetical protein
MKQCVCMTRLNAKYALPEVQGLERYWNPNHALWKDYIARYQPGVSERFIIFDGMSSCPFGDIRGPWDFPNLMNFLLLDK